MSSAVYNATIPDMLSYASRAASGFRFPLQVFVLVFAFAVGLKAADWSGPEQQLARKILAVTGPGAVALTIDNHSSLNRREIEVVGNGLRATLQGLGLHFVKEEQAAATVIITLSNSPSSYVWVAQIRQGSGETSVVMVSTRKKDGPIATRDSVPLSLRKTTLWTQKQRILDVAVLEEGSAPTLIAVLDGEKISLYRMQGGKWQPQENLELVHSRPWPRDLRGRIIPAKDHLLDVYLPGVRCLGTAGAPLSLSCHESDDPWPLITGSWNRLPATNFQSFGSSSPSSTATIGQMDAFFAPSRNFFTGALTPGIGKLKTVAKFYSAAPLPREKYVLWLFSSVDGQVHMVDGVTDFGAMLGWGSDLASVKTSCGSGWQVFASSAVDSGGDSIRAFEFPDRDPVPVTAALDLPGELTALWTEARGDTAIAITQNQETGDYEAYRLAVACNQ
jgi:hypothetical protein